MLLLALASPEALDIRGVTAVAGNVPLALTARNARLICELAARNEVNVYAGCPRPLVREPITAEEVHGSTGIDGFEIHEPATALSPKHAVDFIVDTLMAAAEDSLTLVPTGPLTNVAMAMVKEPRILPRIREIVLMGGALREGGNTTPAAEFNVLVDPHAAHVVFRCGRPITVMGLDVTHQALTTPARLEAIRALGNQAGRAVAAMLSFYSRHDLDKYGAPGAPLHDPCTIAYLLQPALFQGKSVNVEIEVGSALTMGASVVDFWGVSGRPANATWIHAIDADGFYDLLTERLGRLP
jgi:purine nucleosidase